MHKKLQILGFLLITWSLSVHVYGHHASREASINFHSWETDAIVQPEVSQNQCMDGQWIGAISDDWNTEANWCNGHIPTSSTNVTIPSGGFQPIIYASAVCNNMIIQADASLTIVSYANLTIYGNWTNSGTFTSNTGIVIFKGHEQVIQGTTKFQQVIIAGTGKKTITNSQFIVFGILSMEESGSLSDVPFYKTDATLQYNTSTPRITGIEWPPKFSFLGGIIIKNTGIITLQNSKELLNCPLSIHEEATLDLSCYTIQTPNALNLKCGALTKGSTIAGTGTLTMVGNVTVTDLGTGPAGALISCPVVLNGNSNFTIHKINIYDHTNTDLTINGLSSTYKLTKYGAGKINLGIKPVLLSNLVIGAGYLIIPVNGQVTVAEYTQMYAANGLIIESSQTGTGSFITATASGSGMAMVECSMTDDAWHLVSSPLANQSIRSFLLTNASVPTDTYANRGMRDYNPEQNQWNDFFTNETNGNIIAGKGFCMRVRTSQEHKVLFTGLLQTGDISVNNLSAGNWNCIGNPFTSAIGINQASSSTNKFLTINSTNLDPAYGAIYIWDQPDESNDHQGKYTIISNASTSFHTQQGQAFMVKMNTGATSVSFNKNMQLHKSSLTLKSAHAVWPTIKLFASVDNLSSSTIVAFNEGMTNGLDPTYDAGLLKEDENLNLYTLLVEDYGIPFAIQALNECDYDRLVIPVGVDCLKGGDVSFSAELLNLPSDCKIILEDKLKKTHTDLSNKIYKTDIIANSNNQNRFYLHTSYSTIQTGSETKNQIFDIWTDGSTKIIIKGKVDSHTIATLYDLQGRPLLSQPMNFGTTHTIMLQGIKSGIYVLQIRDRGFIKVFKLNFTK